MTPDESPPDAVLARRAQGGDERAFAHLVRRHKAALYSLLRRYTGSPDEAQEAAHEAFIAAWRAMARYDPNRPFMAWLRTIAINKARDRGRRAAFQRLLFGSGPEERGPRAAWSPSIAGDAAMIEEQQIAELDQAISRLPRSLKEPLLLTAFEGLSQREAGEILGVSAKAVETRCRRARQVLSRSLDSTLRSGS